ncbi:hypothetical protein Scep_023485 [Stephania cephalantha]|uniref:Peroxidase n=1 Tax=Stephania cephalantha TaxID=152367 RepID=A0AAP0EXI1_9MAGN
MDPPITFSTSLMNNKCLILLFLLALVSCTSSLSLMFSFYETSCPNAEFMVRNTVRSASDSDPTVPGKLLRLLFHDCMVEGCDGSVLLEGNATERSDPANASLGGFSLIESAKRWLELFCPETVSCADILALAARDAVEYKVKVTAILLLRQAGGPSMEITTGRRDGRSSLASNVRDNIVDTSFTMDEMIKLFSSKGLSIDDLVVLSGAHTIGLAHCSAFSDRFEDSNGRLVPVDDSLDKTYAAELAKQCPLGANGAITINNDPETSILFDNQYYKNLASHKGLFQSDSVLFADERTRRRVAELAGNEESFLGSWGDSFLKLASLEVKTGEEGEIRRTCSLING